MGFPLLRHRLKSENKQEIKKMATPKKKRAKSTHNKKPNPNNSSNISFNLLLLLKEPSPNFFPSKEDLLKLLIVISIAVSVAIACNYFVTVVTRQPKPFCNSGDDSLLLSEFCEPCPSNGECFKGNLECRHGYKNFGRICVEDGEINQTAKKLSDLVELCVCEAYVRFTCDGIGTIWVQETDMWKELDEQSLKEKFGLDNESYMYAKQKAMETIENSLETQTDLNGIKGLKCPDWLAEHYKPLWCYIRQWIYDHALILVPVSALVCEILEENAMAAKNVNGKGDPWVVASRLRDHLLLPRERKDLLLWKKVEDLVQEDSRLDQYPKLVKGESKVVWEWQVEGSLSSSRKRAKEAASRARSTHESPVLKKQTPNSGKLLSCFSFFCN
ncbi:hypothetical protein IFM89_019353 [Coptis chinensis]|uniref:Man1/Src1 C-terminal domain-containing protein n=1 Tax=Coptis chinensis TaxID=261450 RepID=A0A835IXC8_9MAGN|nr:hypothetical protein IFM89_019353 [Coptis chinensis]